MAGYTRQSTYTDGDIIDAADSNDEFDQLLAAFNASSGHTHDGTSTEGAPITKLLSNTLTFGAATSGTDITVTFDGESNDGVLKWMEDEDYFEFSDDLLIASTEKIQFRDTAIYINSSADGQLDLVADTEIQIAATTIDMNGAADISGNLAVGGNLTVAGNATVTGTTTFNGGTLTLGDSASDNIVFGADVDSHIIPDDDDTFDLGSSSQQWRNIYIDGSAYIDGLAEDILVATDKKVGFRDSAIYINSSADGQLDIVADTEIQIAATTIDINGAINASGEIIAASLDISGNIDVNGTTNLDVVDIDGAVNIAAATIVATDNKIQFRDTGLYINSSTDGQLDIVADTEVQIAATTVDINGAVDISGNLSVGGNLDVTGTFDLSDSNFTNAGDIQLDSITGDSDTNTSIAFSGSDVITVTTGGETQVTFNNGSILPTTNNDVDLGSDALEFKDIYIDGTAYLDAIDFNGTAITSTAAELNVMDGDTSATSISIADADRLVLNDNGTMVQVTVTNLAAYLDDEITAMPNLVTTAATTVGALDSGSITSGFGTIDTGASAITTTGLITGGSLTVDDVGVNGKVITMTGSTSDTATFTVGTNGTLDIATTDDNAAAANIQITADGTAELAGTTVTLDSSGGITLDADGGTITFADAGSSLGTVTSSGYSGTSATVTVTDSTANTNFPVVFHNESDALLDDTGALRYNPSTGTLLAPNLVVAGTTTTVDTVTMNAANAVIFEGATADDHETTLSIVDPTADRTINLPNQSGTLPVLAAASNTAVTSTPEELNILDGATVVVGEVNALDLGATGTGTAIASKAVILDGNKDYTGIRNLTITGELDGATLDLSSNADIAGTLTQTGVATFTAKPIANAGISVKNGATSAGFIEFFEDSDAGSSKVTVIAPALAADATLTLPSVTGTISTLDDATALAIALG